MRIHTVGHSTRTFDDFAAVLRTHGVRTLVDVRAYPGSRRHPHFSRESLDAALPSVGVEYLWMGEDLGGRRTASAASRHTALRADAFRAYADHMETPEFARGIERLLDLERTRGAVAVMCAERKWTECHRSFLADFLTAVRGVEVVHLLGVDETEPHRVNRAARVEDGGLVYDVGAQRGLFG